MEISITDKRTRILLAAVKVFSEKGFHHAKVEEIAERAGVGKGTVYEYFKSKEELFAEMFKAGTTFYMQKLTDELNNTKSAADKILKIIDIHFRFMTDHRDLARLIMQEHREVGKYLSDFMHEQRMAKIKMLESIVTDGIKQGEIEVVNPHVTAALIFGMIMAASGMYVFSPHAPSKDEILASTREVLFKGILK